MLIVEYIKKVYKEGRNSMQLFFKTINKTVVVSVVGEIDHHTSEEVRDRIDRYINSNSIKNIVFDFTDVSFMDSAGIGVIIGRYKKVSIMDGKVAVVTRNPQIKRMLEISGVYKISKQVDDIDNALLYM